ncbi:MAG: hypothetical protein RL701_1223 [Pseudomonadota bacterium]|jgi:hypothetical protein
MQKCRIQPPKITMLTTRRIQAIYQCNLMTPAAAQTQETQRQHKPVMVVAAQTPVAQERRKPATAAPAQTLVAQRHRKLLTRALRAEVHATTLLSTSARRSNPCVAATT